jgi:hypothetical protein
VPGLRPWVTEGLEPPDLQDDNLIRRRAASQPPALDRQRLRFS